MMRFSIAASAALSVALLAGCNDDNGEELEDASGPVNERDAGDKTDAGRDDDAGDENEDGGLDAGAADDAGEADADTDTDAALDAAANDADTDTDAALDAATNDANTADAETDAGLDGATGMLGDATTDAMSADAGNTGDAAQACGTAGLTLPDGFCARVFAEDLPSPRHMVFTPSGDLFVASSSGAGNVSFIGLRDSDGDGSADMRERVGNVGGNGIDWHNGYLYFAPNNGVLRYALPDGSLKPNGDAEVVVSGLPSTPDHYATSVVWANDHLYVNVGSASNSCQVQNRTLHSPGVDPCPELATRSGIWKFMADKLNQTQADGERFTTGTRNANALAYNTPSKTLFAALNGRDQLHENWPELFSAEDDARLPAEKVIKVGVDNDYGWPYCYFDAQAGQYFLAPEYGGDGKTVGRCDNLRWPAATLPAHWAPLGMTFYEKTAFPAHYRQGAFIANHGSRFAPNADTPLPGYNVVFIPFDAEGNPSGAYERFAEGFAGPGRPLPEKAEHRPVGVAVSPDGALYVSDDKGGIIYRIWYAAP